MFFRRTVQCSYRLFTQHIIIPFVKYRFPLPVALLIYEWTETQLCVIKLSLHRHLYYCLYLSPTLCISHRRLGAKVFWSQSLLWLLYIVLYTTPVVVPPVTANTPLRHRILDKNPLPRVPPRRNDLGRNLTLTALLSLKFVFICLFVFSPLSIFSNRLRHTVAR